VITAQPGPQTKFLSSTADIVIYGGSAGGNKTFSILMEGMRNLPAKGSQSVIFRRETTDIKDGGMWDEAYPLFKSLGCKANNQSLRFDFPQGGFVKFSHLQHEKDKYSHQGKQWGFIGFDEVTQFSETQFFYLLSRNRSIVVNPYMRASCNPDPDSFLVNGKEGWGSGFISWWIGDDGFAIPERDGVVRYFYRDAGGGYDWDTDKEALVSKHEEAIRMMYDRMVNNGDKYDENEDEYARQLRELGYLDQEPEEFLSWEEFREISVKSVTFIKSSVEDNPALLKKNPEYLITLNSLDQVEKQRLLEGNWRIKHEGSIFKRENFAYYDQVPYLTNVMIFSDTAQSTKDTAAYTVFMLVGKNPNGFYILDIIRDRFDADDLLKAAINFFKKHSKPVMSNHPPAVMKIENKSSGIGLNQQLRNRGIPIDPIERGGKRADGQKAEGSKWERATNAIYALNGTKIHLPSEPNQYTNSIAWVEPFISECLAAEKHGDKKGYWDQVDTASDAIIDFYLDNNDMWIM